MPNNDNWPLYLDLTKNAFPRENLVRAIQFFSLENKKGTAIDIGSGAGNDIRFLLYCGWKIFGFDSEKASAEMINREFGNNSKLKMQDADFKNIKFKPVDLINCSYVLPFCQAEYFDKLMVKIGSVHKSV